VNQWRDFFRLGPPDEANGWLPDPVGAIRLARSLLDRDFRDALIAVLVPGTIDPADLDRVAWSRASSLAGHVLEAPAYVRDEPTWDPQAWNAGRLAAVRDRFVRLARVCPAPISAGPYVVTAPLRAGGAGHIRFGAIEQALIGPDHVLAQISDLLDRGLLPGHQIGGGQRRPSLLNDQLTVLSLPHRVAWPATARADPRVAGFVGRLKEEMQVAIVVGYV
jgi:hypothetical protein